MCERQSVPNADFIFFMIMTTELSAGCCFPSKSLCSWGMFWICCIRRLNMGLVFMMSVLWLPCPDVALLRVFPCEQQGCAAGRWPEPGGLPVICLARSQQPCPASVFPHPQPSLHHPKAQHWRLLQHLCFWLAGTRSPSPTGLMIFRLAIPCCSAFLTSQH